MNCFCVSFRFLGRKPQWAAAVGCLVLARDGDPRFVGTANASCALETLTAAQIIDTGQNFLGGGPGLHPLCSLQQLLNGWNGQGNEHEWCIVVGFECVVVGAAAAALVAI